MQAQSLIIVFLFCIWVSHVEGRGAGLFKNKSDSIAPAKNSTSERQSRLLSLFSIVRFSNDACLGANGDNGTCLTSSECTQSGGTASSSCAAGFGVCCLVYLSRCGATAKRNCTYFRNTNYPSNYNTQGQCLVTVSKTGDSTCQLRLDFMAFSIAQPDPQDQRCVQDLFVVTGAGTNVPTICGDNAGQHMYLDMGTSSSISLGFITSGTNTSRTWNIKLTYIPCDSRAAAPRGCLQYFTDASGTIKSFNYQAVAISTGTTDPRTTGRQLSNQDYTVCIRNNQGYCGICYSACADTTNTALKSSFTVSGDPRTQAANTDSACTRDWVQIPCASNVMNSATQTATPSQPCASKLCGSVFNSLNLLGVSARVYSYTLPFEIRYHTDDLETSATTGADVSNMGFCLEYTQQTCFG